MQAGFEVSKPSNPTALFVAVCPGDFSQEDLKVLMVEYLTISVQELKPLRDSSALLTLKRLTINGCSFV